MTGSRGAALILGGPEPCGEDLRRAFVSRGTRAELCVLSDWSAREISRAVIGAEEKLGAIDALAYCAGGPGETWNGMLLDIDEPEWDALMNRRLKGFFLACKYALPYLIGRESPRILLLTPDAPRPEACGLHEYAAAAACRAAAEHMTAELAPYGISVETLTPGRDDGQFAVW